MQLKSYAFMLVCAVACGPSSRGTPGDDGTTGGDGGGGSATADCATDCSNPACSGIDGCPVCGMVDQPQSTPLALPDTNQADMNPKCTTNAQCSAAIPNCVITGDTTDGPGLCAASYVDTLNFVGFGSGATLTDTSKLISVCATMEHSWLRDLQIELISPDGKMVALKQFLGRQPVIEDFLGHANDCDSDASPMPGIGYKYCWTATAATTMLNASPLETWADTACDGPHQVIPAGNYKPDLPFSGLQNAQLNGTWTFRVTDLWAEDNGFLFDWSIQFDPSLISDCSAPIIQ